MSKYLDRVLEATKAKNANEPEFLQTVEEVLTSLEPIVERRPDIVKHKVLGIICYVHWATRVYDDSIILTCQDRQDPRYYYRFGPPRVARLIDKLNKTNGFYFASNDVGSFVTNYVKYAQKISPLIK